MKTRIALAACTAVCLCSNAAAQELFDLIPGVPERPTVEVDLSGPLLGFVAEAARATDPHAADVLGGLEGVHVRVYETLDDAEAVATYVDNASGDLERAGWQRMVYVDDGGEKVRIYVRIEAEEVTGMTVLVLDAAEAVFVNIDGMINPTQLGRIAGAMGMGDMLGAFTGPPPGNRAADSE